ncbi:MAG: hypothetical protein AAF495_25080 [Pseudomonadota bacterium]
MVSIKQLVGSLAVLLGLAAMPAAATEAEITVEDLVARVSELFLNDFNSGVPTGSLGAMFGPSAGTPFARPKRYVILSDGNEATEQAMTAWFEELSLVTGEEILPATDYANILVVDAATFKDANPKMRALIKTAELDPDTLLREAREYRVERKYQLCSAPRSNNKGKGISLSERGIEINPQTLARAKRTFVVDHAVLWIIGGRREVVNKALSKLQSIFLSCLYPHATTLEIEHSALKGLLGAGVATEMTCLDELALRTFNDPRFVRSYVYETLEREIRAIAKDVLKEKSERSVHCQDTPLAVGRDT